MKNTFTLSLVAVAAIMVALAAFYTTSERVTAQGEGSSSSFTREEIEGIIKEYITQNPEVIVTSLEGYQQKMWAEELKRRVEALEESKGKLLNDKDSPVAGNPEGDVKIVEFFDYNCGYCKRMVETITQLLEEDKNVQVIFKELPILTSSLPTDYSRLAAKASLAVYRLAPGKYFDYHQSVMKFGSRPSEEALIELAKPLGIDGEALKAEMAKPEVEAELKEVMETAKVLGVSGTPALIINGELVPGAVTIEQLKELVAKARQGDKDGAAKDDSKNPAAGAEDGSAAE